MDKTRLQSAVPPLIGWYASHKRDLPWRRERTPYAVLVSELMLQQTRVEAVKEKYTAFLEKFPTAEALARAEEGEVMKAWEGLGYYSRARNLHKAAKIIANEGFPATYEGVLRLPGVGEYTAGAISSIALGLKTPAVDGNVMRVLSRFFADGRTLGGAEKREYAAILKEVYPENAGDFTQALMELGAIVCLPNGAPLCARCPWETSCRAHAEKREISYPILPKPRERQERFGAVPVMRYEDKIALVYREKGLLKGLYGFPFLDDFDPAQFGQVIETRAGKHVFTHVTWHMTGYLIRADRAFEGYLWATPAEIAERYAIPSAFKAFADWWKQPSEQK